jgi:hypothetical protein
MVASGRSQVRKRFGPRKKRRSRRENSRQLLAAPVSKHISNLSSVNPGYGIINRTSQSPPRLTFASSHLRNGAGSAMKPRVLGDKSRRMLGARVLSSDP